MKTNIAAPVGGLIILAGALGLAAYTGLQAPALAKAHAASIETYLSMSEKALAKGKTAEAEKLVKKALAVDPSSKAAFAELKKITLSSCPKSTTAPSANTSQPTPATTAPAKTAEPEAESEDEMGCI